jgi:hypothetical protein
MVKNIRDKNIKTIVKTSFDFSIPKAEIIEELKHNDTLDDGLESIGDIILFAEYSKYTIESLRKKLLNTYSKCYYDMAGSISSKIYVSEGVLLSIIDKIIKEMPVSIFYINSTHILQIKDTLEARYNIVWDNSENIYSYITIIKNIKNNTLSNHSSNYDWGYAYDVWD